MLTAEQFVPPVAVLVAPHPIGQAGGSVSLSPSQLRVLASSWVEQGHLDDAARLVQSALHDSPLSEDLLVMQALICEVRHDWPGACAALEQLMAVQNPSPSETWCHYVRVLRCLDKPRQALQAANQGLQQHPGHPVLMHEFNLLNQQG